MTDEVGCQMRGPRIVHGIAITSMFLHRVGSIPRVDHGINASAQWYQNIKRAFPSVLQTIIESVETTAVLILARLIALILAFPLPFRAADTMACIILDFLELTMQWTDTIARYLRKWTFSEQPLTSEEAFLNALLSFEGEMKRTAAGGNKEIVQGYLETQMGLFDKIDDSIESLHRNWDMSAPSDDPGSESELKEKHARLFKQVQETFNEALDQRNLLTWLNGRPSPLEPVWRCLLSLAQALNPTQATLPQFSKRIYFMRVALRTTVHQIKEASKSPDTSLIDDKLKVLDQKIRIAYTWLLNRLLIGLEEVKALIEVIRLGLTWLPILIRKRFGGVRRQEGINPILTAFELDEGIELSPPGSDASSDTVVDSDGTVVEVVQLRNPPGRQQVVETEVPATAESSCCAAAVEETGAEAEDNSDQHSSSGQENSSELEVPNDENRVKSSRPARRRRKNSLK